MKKLLMLLLVVTGLQANWETNVKLDHIELSSTYVEAMAANKRAKTMCINHIAKTQLFRDNMNDTDLDKAKLTHYIRLVKMYCSKVAGCVCRRETK